MPTKQSIHYLAAAIAAVCLFTGLAAANETSAQQGAATKQITPGQHLGAPAVSASSASLTNRRPGVVLSCSVLKWNARRKPLSTLACPAKEGSASVRVYIKLSWMEPSDRPDDYQSIFAPPSTPVMFRSNDEGAFVWLTVRGKEKARAAWISFNELVSLEVQGKE